MKQCPFWNQLIKGCIIKRLAHTRCDNASHYRQYPDGALNINCQAYRQGMLGLRVFEEMPVRGKCHGRGNE
jgi:hypothetical protein